METVLNLIVGILRRLGWFESNVVSCSLSCSLDVSFSSEIGLHCSFGFRMVVASNHS